jgi:TetR/AcrR family transcriptional regulator
VLNEILQLSASMPNLLTVWPVHCIGHIMGLMRTTGNKTRHTDGKPAGHTRDREATTAAILAAAEVEFAQHGLQFARTEDIAKRAGVAKGMIHHYFKTKEQLFEAILEAANRSCLEAIDAAIKPDASPREALLSFVEVLLHAFQKRPTMPSLFLLESIQNQGIHYNKVKATSLYTKLEPILARGIAEGYFRRLDPWYVAVNILGLCNYYYAAANNIALMAQHTTDAFDTHSQLRNAQEVLALVDRGTEKR